MDVLQPEKLKNNNDFIDSLKKEDYDFFIVVAYGKILSKEILEIPKYGSINIHGSILPKYR
ncbi:MAG: formyltransferase family protein [Patescibacteria group bacterium]|nr:formyltransferase family protein [Patescibacteria group bacterium]